MQVEKTCHTDLFKNIPKRKKCALDSAVQGCKVVQDPHSGPLRVRLSLDFDNHSP